MTREGMTGELAERGFLAGEKAGGAVGEEQGAGTSPLDGRRLRDMQDGEEAGDVRPRSPVGFKVEHSSRPLVMLWVRVGWY